MKKLFMLCMAFAMTFSLAACGDDWEEFEEWLDEEEYSAGSASEFSSAEATPMVEKDTDTQWAIYWYLCGSDLESDGGSATEDLYELMEVELPENVQVIIQTGGAYYWENDFVDPDMSQRFLYDSDGLTLVDESRAVNMGETESLVDFLEFSSENYPGQRTMVCFWNHGGGSVSGVAFDEQYDFDSLTLDEMYDAFTTVFDENPDNQPIDIIGFDTCLMATIDTAYTFSDLAKYMVASEEWEPCNGWYYTGIMEELAYNPDIDPRDLSVAICDWYVEGCEMEWTEDDITLSVTDLSKVNDLVVAYDNFGQEALGNAIDDPSFLTYFAKIARNSENYGGNSREYGYTNMVDMGHLAEQSADLLPETSGALLSALEDCVIYNVAGKYRQDSTGLSCYYSYNGDLDDFYGYTTVGASEAFKVLYEYSLTGNLEDYDLDYISDMEYTPEVTQETLPDLMVLDIAGWADMPLDIDREGCAVLTLGPEAYDSLSSISFELYYADLENDFMLCLGTDNDIIADWDRGIFKDNFRGVWGSIDDCLCYMELVYEGDGYNEYSVPILLNGEDYVLSVIYDFRTEEYYIEGARKPIGDSGAADKNVRRLQVGDVIQTIHYIDFFSDDVEELEAVPIDTIEVTKNTAFAEIELGDGIFVMFYLMEDYQGNYVSSAAATFDINRGEITTYVD